MDLEFTQVHFRRRRTVYADPKVCAGCRTCEEACPFRVIWFDKERNKAFKCDFCRGDPECVKWCPVNALGITEFGEEIAK